MSGQLFPEPPEFEIPAFLRRNPTGEQKMTAQTEAPATAAPAKKQRRQMRDAYVATVKVTIPVDMTSPSSIADAATAVQKLKDGLPEGAVFESEARMGKIEAA